MPTLASLNVAFAQAFQAFMCESIFALSSADEVSRKATPRVTPFDPQYFVVSTAIANLSGSNPNLASASDGDWLTGLMLTAVRAASMRLSCGSVIAVQGMNFLLAFVFGMCHRVK